jgi:hypothetical protein
MIRLGSKASRMGSGSSRREQILRTTLHIMVLIAAQRISS